MFEPVTVKFYYILVNHETGFYVGKPSLKCRLKKKKQINICPDLVDIIYNQIISSI